uniref:Neprosin PEP catalytic domain-containing protein n=1 Tax=Nicotiana tabacum TaxID=4097 RepID=A0A1S4C5I6_TOBAC|nr:PREDICTED: uncharacterized protein LOC107815413 [Nicotiana tabacum]
MARLSLDYVLRREHSAFIDQKSSLDLKKYGDTYDCVNFYKQPAFDHPLLQNHDIHPKIKSTLASTLQNSDMSAAHEANESSGIWLKERGCPFETVPIKRITKDGLIRQRHIPPPEAIAYEAPLSNSNNNSEPKRISISSQGYKLAIVQIPNNPNNKFAGAGMLASLWNPRIESQRHTACRLKIQKGSNSLQAGWRVGNTHCFNTLCPGFVIVSSKYHVDGVFDPVTQRGDKRVLEIPMFIERDLANGNWWLLFGESNEQVGFWPQRLFSNLASFATSVERVAYSPPGVSEPPMGSSYFPIGDPNYDAYCRRLNVLNGKGEIVHIDKTTVRVDDSDWYGVMDVSHWRGGKYQHMAFYGGPGGFETLC